MKLRAIEITNVRRFAGQRARLAGIGDSITVLSEPNEFGKSTFFDALHALFFERHRSSGAAIRALRPHSGGGPEVAAELDLPEGRFRLAKRWLSRPQARVTDAAGRLVAAEDEAEAWIDRLMGGGLAGPSGLLWVRQGLLGLEPEGSTAAEKGERERGLATRRDLLSSVAGEIEVMTGGRRMDAVAARAKAGLEPLATDTGKPRAGGEWKRALDEVEALAAQEAALRPRAAALSGDLARRAEVLRALSRLADPADAAARAEALQRANAAHRAALDHRAKVDAAATALQLARLNAQAAEAEVLRLDTLAQRTAQARQALDQAEALATTAQNRAADLAQRDQAAAATATAAAQQVRDLRARLVLANRAQAAQAARAQAADLRARLDSALALQSLQDSNRGRRARITVSPKALETAEKAQAASEQARARAEAQAVTVEALPDGPALATLNGAPLPSGPVPVHAPVELALPGFGRLRVNPGSTRTADAEADLARATATLDRALAACGAATLAQARSLWAEAQQLDAALAQAVAVLAGIAPDGIDTLRRALATAQAAAADAPDTLDRPETLAKDLASAERAETEARAAADAVHRHAVEAGEVRGQAEGERRTAERRLSEAAGEAGDADALQSALAQARGRSATLAETRAQAADALSRLQSDAPDAANTEARLARATSSVQQAAAEEARLRAELAQLNTRIEVLAEEGIEERLSDLAGRLAEASARATRWAAEVQALTRLRRALDEARAAAREAYFGPVLRELQPLLSLLHPGAALTIDDSTLLPATLTRDGQSEPLDILSGGTREQLAILTRLAFARLFASAGQPVPVILDDALVHSDDDRIEAMFTALHRIARDQQIIVFTCRQRAFAALGGTRATVQIDPA